MKLMGSLVRKSHSEMLTHPLMSGVTFEKSLHPSQPQLFHLSRLLSEFSHGTKAENNFRQRKCSSKSKQNISNVLHLIILEYNKTSVFYGKLLRDHICITCFCFVIYIGVDGWLLSLHPFLY